MKNKKESVQIKSLKSIYLSILILFLVLIITLRSDLQAMRLDMIFTGSSMWKAAFCATYQKVMETLVV